MSNPGAITRQSSRLIMLLGSLALALFFAFLTAWDWKQRENQWAQFMDTQAEVQRLAVLQAQYGLEQQALLLAEQLATDATTQRLTRELAQRIASDGQQDPQVHELRHELQRHLHPHWLALQANGANQLHIHLAPGVTSLLRMHQPQNWGDRLAEIRPLVDLVQQQGSARHGMEIGRYGSGIRGVVPIFAQPNGRDNIIGSLEVGFGMLPELRQLDRELEAGLALLLYAPALVNVITDYKTAGLVGQPDDNWLLDQHSRREVVHWHSQGQIPDPVQDPRHKLIRSGDGDFLLTLIPLHDVASEQDPDRPPAAAALVWKDISLALAGHQQYQRWLVLRWLLAFLAAMALLLTLLMAMRKVVEKQSKRHRKAILTESHEREQARQLLSIITHTQSAYISAQNPQQSFERLLERILQLTGSEFGFVGEVFYDQQDQPYLKTHAISNITWDAESRAFYRDKAPQGLLFSKLDSLFGAVMTRQQAVISNDPGNDPRSGGLPPGHPTLHSLAGLPILFGDKVVGMIGLANRADGYDQALVNFLAPLQRNLGQLIHALRQDRAQRSEQGRLERQRLALRALNEIAALPRLDLRERLHRVLALGCSYLDLEMGIVAAVQEADYQIIAQYAPGQGSLEDAHFELAITYCNLTLQRNDILAIHHMAESPFREQPCYQHFGLEAYIGIPLLVDGGCFGTLAFNGRTPRKQPFDDTDMDFIRLCARWIGALLAEDRAESQRTALMARFDKLVRHLPGVVYQYQQDADGHRWFPFASQAIEDIYGVTPAQARASAETVFNTLHPDDIPDVAATIQQSATQMTDWQATYRVKHPQRGIIWVAGRASPEALDDGSIIWHGFITDVTEAHARNEEIRKTRAYLRAVIDAATEVAIIATDAAGTIQLFNPGAERLLGYPAEAIVGQASPVLFHDRAELEQRFNELFDRQPTQAELIRVFQQPASQGAVHSRIWTYIRQEGERRKVQLSVTPVAGADGQLGGLLGIAIDVTERLQIETLKNEFISTVNHELRTPLTAVVGALGLMRGGALGTLPEPMQRLLTIAEQNTQQLGALINDLLDLDKLSAGQVHFDIQWLPLQDALAQAINVNQPYADRFQVHLSLITPLPALEVAADPRRLAQVLANLLSNASKFSPAGGQVALAAEAIGERVRIRVNDQGPGIAPEFHSRIFSRFAQADGSSTRQHGGTGLGLAICRELVRQMGGEIDFHSVPGQGASFWFDLPARSVNRG